ncbi:hypothetical protein [Odoribacter splanchnicus]|uniref:hypothetical protein n=1 Tax=Odoribacter splanchnicus TaxID=28118 RepID=UPI0011C14984|nr:hypothetical protein [Odoribacter splanchnicus]
MTETKLKESLTWSEIRKELKEKGITEKQFHNWLVKADKGESPEEMLQLITNHVFHSTEEHLYAPPHLRGILPKSYHQIQI